MIKIAWPLHFHFNYRTQIITGAMDNLSAERQRSRGRTINGDWIQGREMIRTCKGYRRNGVGDRVDSALHTLLPR